MGLPLGPWGAWSACGGRGRAAVLGRVLGAAWLFYLLLFHTLGNLDLHDGLQKNVFMRFWL